jgi:hypothetical protein
MTTLASSHHPSACANISRRLRGEPVISWSLFFFYNFETVSTAVWTTMKILNRPSTSPYFGFPYAVLNRIGLRVDTSDVLMLIRNLRTICVDWAPCWLPRSQLDEHVYLHYTKTSGSSDSNHARRMPSLQPPMRRVRVTETYVPTSGAH